MISATIGPEDMRSSNGAQLTTIGAVLQQDRVDFHRFGIRQKGDSGDAIFNDQAKRALGAGPGFSLSLVLMAGLREESELAPIPRLMRGTALNLIIAGILSMAFMGFAGLFSA